MNDQELSKQICNYADAITAFAFVQGIGFGLLLGQEQMLANNVRDYWFLAAPIIFGMNCLFFWSVHRSHRLEDRLIGIPATRSKGAGAVVPTIRKAQLWIISVIGALEIALVFGVAFWPEESAWRSGYHWFM